MAKNTRDGKLLTTEELSERWQMDSGTLENWRQAKKGPVFIKLGSKAGSSLVRYRESDVIEYEKKMERK